MKQSIFILQILLTILIPILLVLLSVRLMLTETWLKFEYNRAGFPEDLYGWDKDVRLTYGPYGIRYLLNDSEIAYLGDLQIDGAPAFRPKELDHMEDVKVVTQAAMEVLTISLIVFILGIAVLAYFDRSRLPKIFLYGGITTLVTIIVLVIVIFVSWDFFFDTFHALFFSDGTWQFYRDDTLIRLYPQQFWFDSSLVVGVLTIGGALLCIFIPLWLSQDDEFARFSRYFRVNS